MRVMIVGDGPDTASVGEALRAAGIVVELRGADPPASEGSAEIPVIARALRDFERALSNHVADGVLVVSRSPVALAAIIVATKLGTPVARLEPYDAAVTEDANARVIRQLADTALAPNPAAIVKWLRGGYSPQA